VSRKSVTFLNRLRLDVDTIQMEMDETGTDIQNAAGDLSHFPVHELKTNDVVFKETFDELVQAHKEMGKLLKEFRIARANYLEFF
jgi:hypothetical protein